jgi:protein-S-isoprenylcysteine O-methyltransferase Ste14
MLFLLIINISLGFIMVNKMSEGHRRKSHEHRKDLAGEFKWGDTGQIIFLIVFIIGMVSDIIVFKISDSWQAKIPWYYRIVVFLLLFFGAGYFAQKAHKKIFDEVRENLIVIKTDIYSKIRHPMYFGSLLCYLSFVVLSLSIIAFVIFIFVVLFYYYLCRYEERLLIEKLGNDYKNYMKKVPMLIPKIRT